MAVLIALCTLVLAALVVLLVSAPVRRARSAGAGQEPPAGADAGRAALRREELEAAREAKYHEIRDAELDFRTGKLSERDYRALDAELRAEALRILDELDALGEPADAAE